MKTCQVYTKKKHLKFDTVVVMYLFLQKANLVQHSSLRLLCRYACDKFPWIFQWALFECELWKSLFLRNSFWMLVKGISCVAYIALHNLLGFYIYVSFVILNTWLACSMWQQTHVIKICLSDLTAFNLAFLSRTFGRQKRITFNIANVTFYNNFWTKNPG